MQADERIMAAINPKMRLTRDFFRDVYAVGMSNPDFPDKAIKALERAGCLRAQGYYETWVSEYEAEQEAVLKEVGHWYAEQCRREARERERRVNESRRARQSLTKEELTVLCQKLLKEGVIKTPEQFATAVLQDL